MIFTLLPFLKFSRINVGTSADKPIAHGIVIVKKKKKKPYVTGKIREKVTIVDVSAIGPEMSALSPKTVEMLKNTAYKDAYISVGT